MPKIEVTLHDDIDKANGADGDEDKTANGGGSSEDVLNTVAASETAAEAHKRTKSLSMRHRKKSIMGNLEVSKLKNFKSFVESKILSKSDRSLAEENESGGGGGGGSRGEDSIVEKASLSDRRASRTSMQGLEVRICVITHIYRSESCFLFCADEKTGNLLRFLFYLTLYTCC